MYDTDSDHGMIAVIVITLAVMTLVLAFALHWMGIL